MHGVSDFSLMSPSSVGGWIFGTGVMFESFQIDGTTPDITDTLNILVTCYNTGWNIVRAGCLKGFKCLEFLTDFKRLDGRCLV